MRLDAGQHMRMSQQMKLAPRMIQSMEILQLPLAALEERIEQELASNPTLEQKEPGDEDSVEGSKGEGEGEPEVEQKSEGERELTVSDDSVDSNHADDFERLSNMSEEYGESWNTNTYEGESYRPARDTGDRDAKMDAMANTAARGDSLGEQLLDQWHLIEMTPEHRVAGEYLIGFLDADGYLRTDRQTMLEQAPPTVKVELLDEALGLLQENIEPQGIGARDLRECLLLQIDAKLRLVEDGQAEDIGEDRDLELERTLVADHLKDIEANRLPKIAKDLGRDIEDIKRSIGHLRRYHPHPGRMLVEDNSRSIVPDAIIDYDEDQDRYVARLRHERLPALRISKVSEKMAKDKTLDRKTRDFVKNNIHTGQWLIDAIQQRHNTVMRVINVVIDAQREFFDYGPQHLKPLPMTTVADQLGIHVATVSRAVSEKYIQSPRGIFPLRMFFSGGTETEGGEAMSWGAVQAKLKEVIGEEDKSNPLSDDELVVKLKEKGIEIARRTVAKYRKQLGIAPARQRKEY
ncbi:MAG: RNA polymerase factor sigma-54 [Phycisphaeraceae bacterium]